MLDPCGCNPVTAADMALAISHLFSVIRGRYALVLGLLRVPMIRPRPLCLQRYSWFDGFSFRFGRLPHRWHAALCERNR